MKVGKGLYGPRTADTAERLGRLKFLRDVLGARIRREEVPLALAQADGLLAGKLGVTEAASALQIAARFPDDGADGWWPHRRADPGPHGRLTVKPDGSPLQRGPGHAHRGRSERGRLHPDSGGDYDPLYGSFVGDQGAWSTPRCTSPCLRTELRGALPCAKAALRSLPSSPCTRNPDVGHRLLGHALDLALLQLPGLLLKHVTLGEVLLESRSYIRCAPTARAPWPRPASR